MSLQFGIPNALISSIFHLKQKLFLDQSHARFHKSDNPPTTKKGRKQETNEETKKEKKNKWKRLMERI